MRRVKLAVALALALCALPALAGGVRVTGDRLFVPVIINGVATEALLDSGAEMTLLDAGFARRLGLELAGSEVARGTGGEEEVRFATGLDIRTTDTVLEDSAVAVLDLSDISTRLVGEPLTAVMGRELFDSGRFLLDIQGGTFERLDAGSQPEGIHLPLGDQAGIKQIPVLIENVQASADFDLGNGSNMLVGRDFAAANGWLSPERRAGKAAGGGLGGALTRDLVRLRSVTVAGVRFADVTAAVDPTDTASEANVGVSLLRNFVLVIDFPGGVVWLAPRESAARGTAEAR